MPAYAIFIRNKTHDADLLKAYGQKAAGARGDHPLTALAAYGPIETLEGDEAEGVVLLQFPSMEAGKAWYDSQAYQDAKDIRLKAADYRVLFFEGL
ncbi:MAG: DUF1330 domain-containing protein [Phenylobacterium sp.]|uniref:DUF1330 domain-containing protein n=1 Tax=Phenylobacterium sp. TaxID=1871053 RepID=UPI001A43599A|nr:DUF1330 domain-containing protein [Phenylobacterium sp.]MBL8552762.1 DUF1330 domain-containing protein [Phenylobacterium sp.]